MAESFELVDHAAAVAFGVLNSARRTLTVLHVAHLRVNLNGEQTVVASGTCEPGDYYGPPVTSPPASAAVGVPGASGTGTICPLSGIAHGLSAKRIEQTDDLSGGQTRTEVPVIEATSPIARETLYGPFIATAQAGLPGFASSVFATGTPVALTITRAGSGRPVFHARNVDSASGVTVRGLPPGAYLATWVLTDAMNTEPYRSARRVFWIVDNGSSHCGRASVQRMAENHPRARLIHLPVHASWLNQIELYFSIVQRKALTPNDFSNLQALTDRLTAFAQHYRQIARPFEWTFTRHDLQNVLAKIADREPHLRLAA